MTGANWIAAAAITVLVGSTTGCSSVDDPTDEEPDGIGAVTLFVHELTTVPGAWLWIPARITDTAGRGLSLKAQWTSTAPAVATVDSSGAIRAVGIGAARVVARYGNHADTLRLDVAPVRFTSVSVAPEGRSCAVTVDDDVYCWGQVDLLPDTTTPNSAIGVGARGPIRVSRLPGLQQLATGMVHSCALVGGFAECWGSNFIGMLGQGTVDSVFHPDPAVVPGHVFTRLARGFFFTCGLEAGGDAYCWGYNGYGELGDSTYGTIRPSPVLVRGGIAFRDLAAGGAHTCGLDDSGLAYCWGNGSPGLGPASATDACVQTGSGPRCTVPIPLDTVLRFSTLDAGWEHTCGIAQAGRAWCWGYGYGSEPVLIDENQSFTALATGAVHACALAAAGEAWCWGDNGAGQLGIGQLGGQFPQPQAVLGGHSFTAISAGGSVTCGITTEGRAYCWGSNYWGEIGDGTDYSVDAIPTPTEVVGQRLQ